MNKFKISVWEFLLIQIVFYAIVWFISEYIGSLLCLVLSPIFFMVLVVALIAEAIDRSRVPRVYFYYMVTAILAPAVVGLFFAIVYEGKFDWLQN